MAQKNYVSLNRLSDFLDGLKNKFAAIAHKHTIADITDYTVDDALSSTSANPVQNKVINEEFEAVATAMNALDLAIDVKTDEAYVDAKVDASIAEVKIDSSNKDAVVLYEAQAYTDAAIANSISQPIIDVLTLPTDNVDTNAFYRSKTANFVANNEIQNGNTTIIYVDALPETGLPAVDLDTGDLRWYYNTSDGVVYGYIDETMSEMASSAGITVPVGWYPFNTLYEMTGIYCDMAIILVDALPEQGLPALDFNNEGMCLYYNASDNIVYSYITNTMSEVMASEFSMTVPSGWYPFENSTDLLGVNYGGVITSMDDAVDADAVYILISSALYSYNSQWEPLQKEQEVIQSDWNQEDDTQPDYIWNKPVDANGKIYPSYLYQPDWNQTNQYEPDYIKNKPAEVVESGKIKSEYLYQPDWDVCDESKPDSVKNRPIYTVPAGTVWYDDICNEFGCEAGIWSEQIFYNFVVNPELEYNIEWGSLQFFNKKLKLASDRTDLGDSCYIYTSTNGYGGIHDGLGRITEPSRLIITVAQDYVKKLDEKYLPDGYLDDTVGRFGTGIGAEIFNNYAENIASGSSSHAEGDRTTASSYCSHAEGCYTTASGRCSHAEGSNTTASGEYQHVQGKYNIKDANNSYAHIVGNGTGVTARSNAHTLDWDGNAWFQGNVYVGGTGQDDAAAKRLLTEDDMPSSELPTTTTEDNGKVLTTIDGSPVWEEPNSVDILVYDDGDGNISINLDDENNQIVNFKPNQTMTNLVETNSTFKDGITDWQFYNQTEENGYTTVEPEGICWHFTTFDKGYYYLRHRIATPNVIVGHKYYFSSRLKYEGTAPITPYVAFGNLDGVITVSETAPKKIFEWTYVSSIKEPTTADAPYGVHYLVSFGYGDSLTCNPDTKVYFNNAICIDLTEVFGEGNEPDIATMDKLIQEQYPYGFEGAAPLYITDNGANSHQMKTLTIGRTKYEFLPQTTDADEGKLLQIVDGVPAWVTIANGNEVAY